MEGILYYDPVRAAKNRSEPSVYASFPFPGWISNPNPNDMGELVWKAGGFVAPFFSLGSLLFSASAIRKESEITENSAQKYHWIQIGSAGNSFIKHCPIYTAQYILETPWLYSGSAPFTKRWAMKRPMALPDGNDLRICERFYSYFDSFLPCVPGFARIENQMRL